jgi:hypothetical protein
MMALLRLHAPGPEFDALHKRHAELNESLVELEDARFNPPPGRPRLSGERYYELRAAIETKRDELKRQVAIKREASLLQETLSEDWTPELWASKPFDWQRLIISLCTSRVTIEPRDKIASRDPETGRNRFDPSRVRVEFVV